MSFSCDSDTDNPKAADPKRPERPAIWDSEVTQHTHGVACLTCIQNRVDRECVMNIKNVIVMVVSPKKKNRENKQTNKKAASEMRGGRGGTRERNPNAEDQARGGAWAVSSSPVCCCSHFFL